MGQNRKTLSRKYRKPENRKTGKPKNRKTLTRKYRAYVPKTFGYVDDSKCMDNTVEILGDLLDPGFWLQNMINCLAICPY
jgi:hypothetical protein